MAEKRLSPLHEEGYGKTMDAPKPWYVIKKQLFNPQVSTFSVIQKRLA